MHHKRSVRSRRPVWLTAELLEHRYLLSASALTGTYNPAAVHRMSMLDFLKASDIGKGSDPLPVAFGGVDYIDVIPVLMAGKSTGAQADTPAMRIDPNTNTEYAGVVGVEIVSQSLGSYICTGTVIAPTFVLTAGHCGDLDSDGDVDSDVTGKIHLNQGGSSSTINFQSITNHPDFAGFTTENGDDLAMIELASPVPAGTPIYQLLDPSQPEAPLAVADRLDFVGYGVSGNPDIVDNSDPSNPTVYTVIPSIPITVKRIGSNTLDVVLSEPDGDELFWIQYCPCPPNPDPGLGNRVETVFAPGDSGGPAFRKIDGENYLSGVNTFVFAISTLTGEFGSYGGGVILEDYLPWIASYINVDLVLTSAETFDPVFAGSTSGTLKHTLTVKNDGPNDATSIEITEAFTLPTGVSITSVTPSVGTYDSINKVWSIPSLAASSSATLQVSFDVPNTVAAGSDVIKTVSTVTSVTEPDTSTSGNSITEMTSVATVDIELTQTESVDPAVAGSGVGNLVYEVTAKNNGSATATGISIAETLTLPSGVSEVSIVPSDGTYDDTTDVWSLTSLAAGASEKLTITLTVDDTATPGTDVVESAAAVTSVTQPDVVSSNDSVSTKTSIGNVDIELTQTESIDPVVAGSGAGNLIYEVTAKNNGSLTATGISILETLTLPSGVSEVSIVPSDGTYDDTTDVWSLTSLAAGASEKLTITLTVDGSTAPGIDIIKSEASLTAVTEPDVNSSNDSILTSTSTAFVDIGLSQTESSDPVTAGSGSGNLVYIVTATNFGSVAGTGINIEEVLDVPTGVSIDTVVASAGSYSAPNWTLTSLAPGASETLTITLTASSSTPAGIDAIESTATITALNETDDNTTNDSTTETSTVLSVGTDVELSAEFVEVPTPVVLGPGTEYLNYVLSASNIGTVDATNVTILVNLTLPTGVTVDSHSATAGTYVPITWSNLAIASGTTETLTITLAIDPTASGEDMISVTSALNLLDETDTNANNNVSIASRTVSSIDVALSMMESVDPVTPGSGAGNLVYTLTATNNGTTDATGVEIDTTLTLPTGVTFDTHLASLGSFSDPTWSLSTLAAGTSETLQLTLTAGATTAAGTDVIQASSSVTMMNESDGDSSNDMASVATSVLAAPVVNRLKVAGSTWTDASDTNNFLGAIDPTEQLGHTLPTEPDQLKALPWRNINTIYVDFSEDVVILEEHVALFVANAANPSGIAVALDMVSYDSSNFRLTIETTPLLNDGKYLLAIDDAVVSATSGLPLDGDFTNADKTVEPAVTGSSLPSGDGVQGNKFEFVFNVQHGDASQSGFVDVTDLNRLGIAFGGTAGNLSPTSNYNPLADFNASGSVDVTDLQVLGTNFGDNLVNSLSPPSNPLFLMPIAFAFADPDDNDDDKADGEPDIIDMIALDVASTRSL